MRAPVIVRTITVDLLEIQLEQRLLQRSATEPLKKTLTRLADDATLLDLHHLPLPSESLTCAQAWPRAAHLRIKGQCTPVLVDPPEISAATCHVEPLAGVPIAPRLDTRRCTVDGLEYSWELLGASADEWRLVSNEPTYAPALEDVDRTLRLRIAPPAPGTSHPPLSYELLLGRVRRAPPRPFLATRLAALGPRRSRSGDDSALLRVMSYNLLADTYKKSWEEPRGVHSYCSRELTAAPSRMPRLLGELIDAQPDVVVMQEMDSVWYDRFWEPSLRAMGYDARYTLKQSVSSSEGLALAVRRDAFSIEHFESVPLSLDEPSTAIRSFLDAHEPTRRAIQKLPTVGQLALLRQGDRQLLVLNSHLYFANPAVHVRSLQTAALLDAAEAHVGSQPTGIIFAGDLNSDATDAALHLLLRGSISASHRDWLIGLLSWGPSHDLAQLAEEQAAALIRGRGARADPAEDAEMEAGVLPLAEPLEEAARVARQAHLLRAALKTLGRARLESSLALDSDELMARAIDAASDGKTLLDSPELALVEVSQQLGYPSPSPLEAASARLRYLGAELRERLADLGAAQSCGLSDEEEGEPAAAEPPSEAAVETGVRLGHPFELQSAYSAPWRPTHCVREYVNALDWLCYGRRELRLVGVAPLPTVKQARAETAMPSVEFPSDHVSLIADFEWSDDGADR